MNITAETCRAAAAVLRKAAQQMPQQALFELCADCLDCMTVNEGWARAEYQPLARPFIDEAAALLGTIASAGGKDPGQLGDLGFALLECLAVIFRERSLRGVEDDPEPLAVNLLSYFEGCGHWPADDTTLVSLFYYTLLPYSLRPRAISL